MAHRPLKTAKQLGRSLGVASTDSLRVLLYHDIAPVDQERFAAQLTWLRKSWTFVSPERFAAIVSGEAPAGGRSLLLTFDDGFASNRAVAEEVLGPLGIQALFFVVSDFVEQADPASARRFIARHIRPGSSAADLPPTLSNMEWSDLATLVAQGHTVGAHTKTHSRLSSLRSRAKLQREIVESADALSQRLGVSIEHFAYTFGDIGSFSPEAMATARERFRFVYSGLRGDNRRGVSPFALRRDSVTADEPTAVLGAFVEGVADFRYARARRQLDDWARRGSIGAD